MDYVEARDLVRIRRELREHLRAERVDEANVVLTRLGEMASADPALHREYERWCVRFGLLASDALGASAAAA